MTRNTLPLPIAAPDSDSNATKLPSDPRPCVPDTTTCDSGHRPGVLKHCMMRGYNDRCEQSSTSLVAEHRADVRGESRYRMRASGRDAYAR